VEFLAAQDVGGTNACQAAIQEAGKVRCSIFVQGFGVPEDEFFSRGFEDEGQEQGCVQSGIFDITVCQPRLARR
jgi:hypothetical protein